MTDFEKLGQFYLGKRVGTDDGALRPDELVLYDAKDLTTHAFCVGMTGSGKTGLCVSLLEEAAIDGIPAIVIDPKGDLGNLALRFPELRAEDFLPYIDPAEASRKGQTPAEHAGAVASQWRAGLADWGQDGERIRRFRDAAEVVLYTPGSQIARPISIMRSLAVPPAELRNDPDALRERVLGATSGLLGMLGIEADPVRSREHIFLSNVLSSAWANGEDVTLADLVRRIQAPPFTRVGVMDLETFYPAKERASLAMGVNSILASPGFSAWLEGEPLDVGRLLRRADGHPRISILSIGHLDDAQRMFFVTLLLNEVIAWMRTQSGTSSLRAILYMDEVFGYLPPVANPSSKTPMLTLLKQARAFGLGVVLATQNPVDVDYKALSNCGTWMLGRLQTERDMARVLDGLAGAASSSGQGFDRAAMEARLAGLKGRQFVLNNVHDAGPDLFQTRWALSYLRGPLTRDQLRNLSRAGGEGIAAPATAPAASPVIAAAAGGTGVGSAAPAAGGPDESRPVVPAGIAEVFLGGTEGCRYQAGLLITLSQHYTHAKTSTDLWQQGSYIAPRLGRDPGETLAAVEAHALENLPLRDAPPANARFAALPAGAVTDKTWKALDKAIKAQAYRDLGLTLYECKELKLWSQAGEDGASFAARVQHGLREARDLEMAKLRAQFQPKLAKLQERIQKAEQKVKNEQGQVRQRQMDTAVNVGTTVLGAILGGRSVARGASAVRSASRISQDQQQVEAAEQNVKSLQEQLAELEAEFQARLDELAAQQPVAPITEVVVRPTKADLAVTRLDLLWVQE